MNKCKTSYLATLRKVGDLLKFSSWSWKPSGCIRFFQIIILAKETGKHSLQHMNDFGCSHAEVLRLASQNT